MKNSKKKISFDGDINELLSLRTNGKFDEDKVYDWILNCKNISFDSEYTKSDIIRKIRKRKIDRLNKK